jgi:hypothetical protein
MNNISKRIITFAFLLVFLLSLGMGDVYSQAPPKEKKGPEIKLGEIRFQIRDFGSPTSQIRMLEIYIEVLNQSRTSSAPPNSVKVVATPKEVKFPEGTPVTEFAMRPEEVTLNLPLAPSTGRVLIIGYSLLEAKPESITFEIQVNPPDGEKKTVKWEGS